MAHCNLCGSSAATLVPSEISEGIVAWQMEVSLGVWKEMDNFSAKAIEAGYNRYLDCTKLPIHARAISLEALLRFTNEHSSVRSNFANLLILLGFFFAHHIRVLIIFFFSSGHYQRPEAIHHVIDNPRSC
jgi:hypothetical protein